MYFFEQGGTCRHGEKCRFSHIAGDAPAAIAPTQVAPEAAAPLMPKQPPAATPTPTPTPTLTPALAPSSRGAPESHKTANPIANGKHMRTQERSYQLFVTGLNEQVRKDDLRAHLEAFGTLAVFIVKFESRRRGYAFVSFTDPACADKALASGAQQTVSGVSLLVKRFVDKSS